VYKHLDVTPEWSGVKHYNTRNKPGKDIALHGEREASKALRTYERLTKTEKGGERRVYSG
jgi:hypothetical protein